MKPGTKSFIKIAVVLVLVFAAYCVATVAYRSTFAPDDAVDNYSELKLQGVPMTKARRISNPPSHICIFGDINSVMWTLPSGPPAYLFDSSGKLVDYTLDVGDSTKFQYDYSVYSGEELTIAEAEDIFKVSRKK